MPANGPTATHPNLAPIFGHGSFHAPTTPSHRPPQSQSTAAHHRTNRTNHTHHTTTTITTTITANHTGATK